jgi:hypothetical protein
MGGKMSNNVVKFDRRRCRGKFDKERAHAKVLEINIRILAATGFIMRHSHREDLREDALTVSKRVQASFIKLID